MEPWSVVAFEAAMAMLSPGRGLGSGSAGLDFVVDVPKSAIVTVSLPERASAMVETRNVRRQQRPAWTWTLGRLLGWRAGLWSCGFSCGG